MGIERGAISGLLYLAGMVVQSFMMIGGREISEKRLPFNRKTFTKRSLTFFILFGAAYLVVPYHIVSPLVFSFSIFYGIFFIFQYYAYIAPRLNEHLLLLFTLTVWMIVLTEWQWNRVLMIFTLLAAAPTMGILYHSFTAKIIPPVQKFWYTMWFLFAVLYLQWFGISTFFLNEMMDPVHRGGAVKWDFMLGSGMGMMLFFGYIFLISFPLVVLFTARRTSFKSLSKMSDYLPFGDEQLSRTQAYLIIGAVCGIIGVNQWLKLASPYLLINLVLGNMTRLHGLMVSRAAPGIRLQNTPGSHEESDDLHRQ